MKPIKPWAEIREARLQAVLLRDQRRADRAKVMRAERPKNLRLTLELIERWIASIDAVPKWRRVQRRHLLFWRSKLGPKTSLRNLPRAVISEALRDQSNQGQKLAALKAFFVWLEKAELMDSVENGFSGLALEDVLFESVEKTAPRISA